MTEYEHYLALEKDLLLQKQNMIDILTSVGVEATSEETFNTLIPKFTEYINSTASKLGVNTLLSSAIKQNVSGETVLCKNVSPLEHNLKIQLTSDTITDFSSVNVSRYGKNLFDATLILKKYTYGGITVESEADGFKFYGTATRSIYIDIVATPDKLIPIPEHWKNKDLTIYCYGNTTALEIGFCDDNGNLNNFGTQVKGCPDSIIQVNTTGYTKFWFRLRFTVGVTYDDFVRIMVCEGLSSTDTPYEPYIEPQTVIATTDGTVEGLTSLSPSMTLIPDTEGIVIDCTYNIDTKTYIDNEFAKVEALVLEG